MKKAIICVDDEKIILNSLKSQLKKFFGNEYIYETVDDPVDVLDVIDELVGESVSIFVIVSDWLMPRMKGDELLIKIHEKYPKITKILLTGQASKDAVEMLYDKVDLHECVLKPWNEDDLFETMLSGLKKAEALI